jgi:hypothetical protein
MGITSAATPDLRLRIVTRTQGNNQALKDGTVRPRTCAFEFVEVDPLIDAFRRMVRGLEFDVSEMALTTYITARAHGKRFIGLPIFLVRAFHHGATVYNAKSGIKGPKDLEGRKVGVNRGYTVTTGVWARGVLQHQYGVDLDTFQCGANRKREEDGRPYRVRRVGRGNRGRRRFTGCEAADSQRRGSGTWCIAHAGSLPH